MTSKEILKILHKDGWREIAQKGSHKQFMHPIKKGKTTVSMHSGDLPKNTLKSILKQAQIEL